MASPMRLLKWGVMLACSVEGAALAAPPDSAAMSPTARVAVEKPSGVRLDAVSVPASLGERTRVALRDAVARNLADVKVGATEDRYSVSVALVQLRRYVGPDEPTLRIVCILDVALHDAQGALVGSLRGRASGASVATSDMLDAAAHSAISRLPEAVRMAEQSRRPAGARASYARR